MRRGRPVDRPSTGLPRWLLGGTVPRTVLRHATRRRATAIGALGPVLFVSGLIVIYGVSAESGVQRGIRRIAGVNIALFGLFALLLVGVGPRQFLLERGSAAVGRYVIDFAR